MVAWSHRVDDEEVQIHTKELNAEDIEIFERLTGLSQATGGRHSMLFFGALYVRTMLQRNLNPQPVIREIRAMEGQNPPTGTKAPTQFTGPWLKGLWHQHYEDVSLASMAMNLRNGWKSQGIPFFRKRIAEAESGVGPKFFTVDDVPAMVDDLVHGAYRRRKEAQALTGEWIIYATHEGRNYYLALWRHADGDELLRREIDRICVPQFPFLKDILPPLPI